MKVAVYLAGVPVKAKNEFKRELLTRFAYGAKLAGDEIYTVDDYTVIDADIAVLQGWIGMKRAPHLKLREDVINYQRNNNKHTLVIDSNLFGFLEPNDFNRYLRYSLDGIFPTTGYYFDNKIDPARWESIKQRYNFVERPWKTDGKYILVCLQRDGGWSMDGLHVVKWFSTIVPEIQQYTDRPILVRGHPGSMKTLEEIRIRWPRVEISTLPDIRQDFDRAWATITYNSSPGVASLLWGVSSWITDFNLARSQAYQFAETNLSLLERPLRRDRTELYHRLSQCHFNMDELDSGLAWQFMRQRLPNTPCQ